MTDAADISTLDRATLRYLPGFDRERRDLSRSQWYTPPDLAERLWKWATPPGRVAARVLEPSAGIGALIKPALRDRRVRRITAVDIDAGNCDALRELPRRGPRLSVVRGDFTHFKPAMRFDLGITNPPYEDDQDVGFVLRLLGFAPVVCGIFRSAIQHGEGRFEAFWRHVDMPRKVNLVNRPEFGEGTGARSDFIVAEFTRRATLRERGEPTICAEEWW